MSAFGPSPACTISASSRARLPLMADEEGGKLGRPRHRRRQADGGEIRRHACASRARSSARRSPRLVEASACSSSMMTVRSEPNSAAASRCDSISAICSGVVSRMSGGERRWRWRREGGVSPVRVSSVIGSPISATGSVRLRAISTASAFKRRDVEGVDAGLRLSALRPVEIDQARQEAGKRLAAAGRRDQQRVAALARQVEQLKLVGVRAPAARGEPAGERLGQPSLRPRLTPLFRRSHRIDLLDLAFFLPPILGID